MPLVVSQEQENEDQEQYKSKVAAKKSANSTHQNASFIVYFLKLKNRLVIIHTMKRHIKTCFN